MLFYKDLWEIFRNTRGINDESIYFEQVYMDASRKNKRGLFVAICNEEHNEQQLKIALYNGAIAAIWPESQKLPRFLPNHFPVFLVDDPLIAYRQLIEHYHNNNTKENRDGKMTQFSLSFQVSPDELIKMKNRDRQKELDDLREFAKNFKIMKGGDMND